MSCRFLVVVVRGLFWYLSAFLYLRFFEILNYDGNSQILLGNNLGNNLLIRYTSLLAHGGQGMPDMWASVKGRGLKCFLLLLIFYICCAYGLAIRKTCRVK